MKDMFYAIVAKVIETPSGWAVVMLCGGMVGAWHLADGFKDDFSETMRLLSDNQARHAKVVEANQARLNETLTRIADLLADR